MDKMTSKNHQSPAKRKIRSIFSICLFLLAVSALDQPEELLGIAGRSVSFGATSGILQYKGVTIAKLSRSEDYTNPKYRGRLYWTGFRGGFFVLEDLKLEDSGVYTLRNLDSSSVSSYNVTVFIAVSKPNVSIKSESPCTLWCSTQRATQVRLSWYRRDELLSGKSLVGRAPALGLELDLPVASVRRGIYTCGASNNVSMSYSDDLALEYDCTVQVPIVGKKRVGFGEIWGLISACLSCVFAFISLAVFCQRRRRARRELAAASTEDGRTDMN